MRCGDCKWFSGAYKCMSNDNGLARGWCSVPAPASFAEDSKIYSYWVCERTEINCCAFKKENRRSDV